MNALGIYQSVFVGKNTDKNSISISWPSNDTGNKAKDISGPFAVRISISIIWNLTWYYFFRNTLELVSYEVWLILCRP